MYQPYPVSGAPQEPARVEPPPTVVNAVRLMFAGAALSAVAVIVALLTISSIKSAILSKDPNFTTAQVHSLEVVTIVGAVIGGLIAIGLWIWMALANRRGQNWARIVSAVLFGINTLDLLASVVRVHATAGLILGILQWLVGLGAIVLIFNRQSAPYYQQQQPVRR